MSRFSIKAALTGALLFAAASTTALADNITTFAPDNVAIHGTDPVAYFTEGKPVAGKDEYTAAYDGVTWKFSSKENRDKFVADPAAYAPQFGGWCATGVSFGVKIPIMPDKWSIVDGKLYLNAHDGAQRRFNERTEEVITNANTNWPGIKETPADKL
ncbi:YHS domain-containing protein [Rhodobacteraceae bacterium RKSG542]|uniref:YHS domain-containing (seleno)protein n=1 Tax=Pseudovibrio flavus TaxID=2529854 RepID=UPI0012BD4369|nr:YHS domain-containing (seleno)protein [Pseudovibrio flavus]MTI16363.1 YHS domain-containing protein [Pseudovibrio flavus]